MEFKEIQTPKELHRNHRKSPGIHRDLAEIGEHPKKWMGKSIGNFREIAGWGRDLFTS